MTLLSPGLRFAALLAIPAMLVSGIVLPGDVLRPSGSNDLDVGALVDGERDGAEINDAVYSDVDLRGFFGALFPRVLLDNFTASPQSNEVIVFARDHVPKVMPNVLWTAGNNAIDVELQPAIEIPITIWVVAGPFDDALATAEEVTLAASAIWSSERQGLRFSEIEIVDATDNPAAETLQDFNCDRAEMFKQLIGHRDGRFNIYFAGTVDFGSGPSSSSGVWCDNARVIGLGPETSDELLTHELGHGLSLQHTQTIPEFFDKTNVMHNSSFTRRHLTEGQTLRSIYNATSAINNLYDVREGDLVRSCIQHTSIHNSICPPIQKRVWPDGSAWPAN